jgi:hypothetical protein
VVLKQDRLKQDQWDLDQDAGTSEYGSFRSFNTAGEGSDGLDKRDSKGAIPPLAPPPRAMRRSETTGTAAGQENFRTHDPNTFDEWVGLQQTMDAMWPCLRQWIESSILRGMVEPKLAGIGVTFTKTNLGNNGVQILGVKQLTANASQTELTFRFVFGGEDVDVEVAYNAAGITKIHAGVTKLTLRGSLCLVFRQFQPAMPPFCGVEMFFANPPLLELELGTQNIKIPSSKISNIISDVIKSKVVVPNLITVNMNPEALDPKDLKFPTPSGLLEVFLDYGRDMPAADTRFGLGLGKAVTSDPYVIFRCGTDEHKSEVCQKNLNPEWNESFEMIIHKHAHQDCFVEVWDEDKMKNHDKLGTQRISVMRLVNESGREWPLTLDDAMKDQQVQPRLKLRTVWRPFRVHIESEFKTKNGVCAALVVVIDKLDGITMETKQPLYAIHMSLDDEEFANTGDVAPVQTNPPPKCDATEDKDKKKDEGYQPVIGEVSLMTSYRKLVKETDQATLKFEMFCAKKKQGEFGITLAEIKSNPMHKKAIDVSVKGSIHIKGFVQLLILGEPLQRLDADWVYEEKPIEDD